MEMSSRENEVTRLKALIETKPRNARLMSKLSCLLAEQERVCKSSKNEVDSPISPSNMQGNERDPLYWADKAIEIAPGKPFGYMALSLVHSDSPIRQENLRKAIQLSEGLASYRTTWIGLLVRSLVDLRQEESLLVRGSLGKAAPNHPSRRALSPSEEETYAKICSALENFWIDHGLSPHSADDTEFIIKREYRLGLFFRKMEPMLLYRSRSQSHFKRVLRYLPDEHEQWSLAQFWLATMDDDSGNDQTYVKAIQRCPKSYVVGLYSTFAEGFDTLLEKLAYQTPREMRFFIDEKVRKDSDRCFSRTVDLGCGTGLSGMAFRDCSKRLEGIDLSPEMVEKAKERGCYDKLVVGDIIEIFDEEKPMSTDDSHIIDPASLVIACDVFCYIGDLEPVFAKVHNALETGGIFAFSTELLVETSDSSDKKLPYQLHNAARFAHSQEYVEELAQYEGLFAIDGMKRVVLRKNRGENVSGLLSIIRKLLIQNTAEQNFTLVSRSISSLSQSYV